MKTLCFSSLSLLPSSRMTLQAYGTSHEAYPILRHVYLVFFTEKPLRPQECIASAVHAIMYLQSFRCDCLLLYCLVNIFICTAASQKSLDLTTPEVSRYVMPDTRKCASRCGLILCENAMTTYAFLITR